MKEIIQHAVITVVQRQVVRYTCDRCGKVCGTRENRKTTRKTTWHSRNGEFHYCEKTCHPADHPTWVLDHVLNCTPCYEEVIRRQDGMHIKVTEAVLGALGGNR